MPATTTLGATHSALHTLYLVLSTTLRVKFCHSHFYHREHWALKWLSNSPSSDWRWMRMLMGLPSKPMLFPDDEGLRLPNGALWTLAACNFNSLTTWPTWSTANPVLQGMVIKVVHSGSSLSEFRSRLPSSLVWPVPASYPMSLYLHFLLNSDYALISEKCEIKGDNASLYMIPSVSLPRMIFLLLSTY